MWVNVVLLESELVVRAVTSNKKMFIELEISWMSKEDEEKKVLNFC
jgi:hypothetical protein